MMTTRTGTAKPWKADFGNVVDGRPNHAGNSAARGETLSTMGNAVATLVLLRHGESEWNASNQFTGWVDVDLTEKGRREAVRGGKLLAEHDLLPDVLYTSLLRRAITTAHLALDAADRLWIPVHPTWRLNQRHY